MPTPTASVKVNPLTGALIDPIAATFASANGLLTGGTSDAKDSVVCATTANGTLATAFENGDTVDGIVLATGNRILIKNQSSQAENGIYTVNASGAPTRATDFDAWTEIVGAFVTVESGTVNAGTQWLCNVVSGGTLNTTAITFVVPKNYVDLTTAQNIAGLKTFTSGLNTTGATSEILTLGANAYIRTTGAFAGISTEGAGASISTIGATASIQTSGLDATIFTTGANAHIFTYNAGAYIQTRSTFKLFGGTYTTTVSHSATADRAIALPDADGTLATTTGNVATATALATARNIFNISFDGTANVAGDATNTGHFASIPGTGAAGHFVTQNGTAPTVIAGRSAWYSDGSGVPSFKNGTGTPVTLVRSSDLGTGIATFLTTPSSANLASAVTDETGSGALVFGTSPTISSPVITNIAPAANFTITQNSVAAVTSVNSGATVNTLYLTAGKIGSGTTSPSGGLHIKSGQTYVTYFEGTGAQCYNTFVSTSGAGEYGIFNDALYFQAMDSLANGIRFYCNTSASAAGTLFFLNNGNFGVGVSPTAKLHVGGTIILGTAGTSMTNIRHGVSGAMVLGVVTVTDTGCTANTRYFFTQFTQGTITAPSAYWASTRTASTSFVITSNQLTETGTVHWLAIEP